MTTAPLPAILIGLDSRTGLQLARVLCWRGVPVIGTARDPRHWAARTRTVSRVFPMDDAWPRLVDGLDDLRPLFPAGAVLIPCTDSSVLALARSGDRLRPHYRFAMPGPGVVESLVDKAAFARVASAAGVAVARTHDIESRDELERVVPQLRLPCVVKPAVKDTRWRRSGAPKAWRIDSTSALCSVIDRALDWSDHLVVQEWVPGPDRNLVTGNAYFTGDCDPEVVVVSAKLRQWPTHTGTASAAVTVDDDEVARLTIALFRSVGFVGLGYLELKRHEHTGCLLAIEANAGRPTGRSVMAEAAGTELHYALYADLAGLDRARLVRPRPGTTWVDLRRDLQAALHAGRNRQLTPVSWLRSLPAPRRHAVASWSDPLPFVLDMWCSGRKLLAGRRHRRSALRPVDDLVELES